MEALAKVVGEVFCRNSARCDIGLARWRTSDELWLQRSAILFQLGYEDKTEVSPVFDIVSENVSSSAFFFQKAIDWALREYVKTDAAVEAFVS